MTSFTPKPPGGGTNGGPPGQDLLGVLLAAATAFFFTPYLLELIGPWVERIVYDAYGSKDFAGIMYFVGFALCGGAIYAATRMFFWYVLGALVAFLAQRAVMGSGLPSLAQRAVMGSGLPSMAF